MSNNTTKEAAKIAKELRIVKGRIAEQKGKDRKEAKEKAREALNARESIRRMIIETTPENFKIDFVPEIICDTFYYGFDTRLTDIGRLKSVDITNPLTIHETLIDIWNPGFDYDYWFRSSQYSDHIILSDYQGIRIYNHMLELVFSTLISASDRYTDVFGYVVENDTLYMWRMNDARNIYPMASYQDKTDIPLELLITHDLTHELSGG
jgi:hypothetical protein